MQAEHFFVLLNESLRLDLQNLRKFLVFKSQSNLAKLEPKILFRFFSQDPQTADEFIDKA